MASAETAVERSTAFEDARPPHAPAPTSVGAASAPGAPEGKRAKDSPGAALPFRVAPVPGARDGRFASNLLITSKYTAWTFVPLALAEQCVRARASATCPTV